MTRYGFAIKALPKGGKPFGDDEDEQLDDDTAEEDATPEATPKEEEDPPAEPTDMQTPPAESEPPADVPAETDTAEPPAPAPTDDARPWSGDMYDEGDETEPAAAFAAYSGTQGEEAWLDQAPDGTLTGWVRDSTGQVWRYSDPDAWAIDVDDAQMTRTHSRADGSTVQADPASTNDRGEQDPLFPPQ